jgi:tryptophan synthase alpha chain
VIVARTGLERIAAAFATARAAGRGALIPYLCAGDPDLATTERMLVALGPVGADIIEVGIPYGDPLADGPTIAASAQRALAHGTSLDGVFAVMARAERAGAPPAIVFTYVNLVVQYGLERFADALVAAGACGAIVPDIPLEETGDLRALFLERGLALPLLVAPTTPPARAEAIARASEGFTYLVSRLGVTGAKREPDFSWIAERVARLRAVTSVPLAIGFGISTAEHVRRAWEVADGAIVGSALIDAYAGASGDAAVARARDYVAGLLGKPHSVPDRHARDVTF